MKILSDTATRKNSDLTGKALGIMRGMFQRFPCNLQKLSVLRVKNRSVLGTKAEKLAIEMVEVFKRCRRFHVIWVGQ